MEDSEEGDLVLGSLVLGLLGYHTTGLQPLGIPFLCFELGLPILCSRMAWGESSRRACNVKTGNEPRSHTVKRSCSSSECKFTRLCALLRAHPLGEAALMSVFNPPEAGGELSWLHPTSWPCLLRPSEMNRDPSKGG